MQKILQFDVVSFSETWLNDYCATNDLFFPSFHPERKDRTHDRYWGVIVYIKNNLSYIRRLDLGHVNFQRLNFSQ